MLIGTTLYNNRKIFVRRGPQYAEIRPKWRYFDNIMDVIRVSHNHHDFQCLQIRVFLCLALLVAQGYMREDRFCGRKIMWSGVTLYMIVLYISWGI